MQRHSKETLQLSKTLGEIVKELRMEKYKSIQKFAFEFDLPRSNCSRIEKGTVDCKITTFYKIAQGLSLKPSELMKILEDKLGDGFSLIDE